MKLRAGKYYIGDPCYIFEKSWTQALNETNYFNEDKKLFGKDVCVGGTAYGDGSYRDNKGNEYWVDAGLIGILPVSLLKRDKVYTEAAIKKQKGMHVFEFAEDFEANAENGVFTFGDIVINTKDEDEDDDW